MQVSLDQIVRAEMRQASREAVPSLLSVFVLAVATSVVITMTAWIVISATVMTAQVTAGYALGVLASVMLLGQLADRQMRRVRLAGGRHRGRPVWS